MGCVWARGLSLAILTDTHTVVELKNTSYSLACLLIVTPSVLRPKPTTKPCHEHHVYVIKHVVKCVDQFLIT